MITARWLLLLVLSLAAALYWPGLSGPLLFDDYTVLGPVEQWHAGKQGWLTTLLPNSTSVVFSRPIAMASFMLSTALGGVGTFPLKLGNLVVHLLCGVLGWWLLRRVLRVDPRLSRYAAPLALAAAAFWLLHPLHVSTVLYAVQRMAQLATLFTLAPVALYLVARQQLQDGRLRPALLNLFITFPLLLLLGLLSKQNAAIAGFLCLVLELAYFQRSPHRRVLQGFFGLFVAFPTLVVAALLTVAPERLLASYAEWDFTVWQRLLTQPRALFDYIGMWFIPRGPQMGLYTDGYPVSTGLLSPPTTLLAIVALVAISVFAIAVRKRAPSVFAGWFFFLVAHAVESSFLPLEMYYEHRNYLPSFGLLLMAFGIATLIPATANSGAVNLRKLGTIGAAALILVLSFATLGRVLVWQDAETIAAQGVRQHPESLRARLDMLSLALGKRDYAAAAMAMAPLLDSPEPRQRFVSRMNTLAINCVRGARIDKALLQRTASEGPRVITIDEVFVAELQAQVGLRGFCRHVSAGEFADSLAIMLVRAKAQPEMAVTKSTLRLNAARLYAHASRWPEVEQQAKLGWQGVDSLPLGTMLVVAHIETGNYPDAAKLLMKLKGRVRSGDRQWSAQLDGLHSLLRQRETASVRTDGGPDRPIPAHAGPDGP